jgi:D-beta-D-heptose 7-phosphate kinase/D-beta-D-heptose 1-phosphate adenosyltransferase
LHRSADIIKHLKSRNKFVIVDPKKSLDNYRNADIVKLNEKEFSKYSEISDYEKARVQYSIGTIIVTRASKPVLIIDSKGISEVETTNYAVSDVTGAGDVFIASLGFYLAKGFDIKEATAKATRLASISVTKFGTYVLTEEDIRKVTPKIIFTNGCFDIIHRGHVEYLQKSKKLGDKLIVGLNSDKSVKSLKGFSRPVNNQSDRKFVLESLGCVDEVIVFNEDTPYELIKRIKPDIITKGGDYTSIDQVVGHDLAQVKLIPFISGYSTTSILERA